MRLTLKKPDVVCCNMLVGVCFVAGFKDKKWVVLFVAVIVASLKVDSSIFAGVCGGVL